MVRRKYDPPFSAAERDPEDYHRQVIRSELVDLRQDIDRVIAQVKADLARSREGTPRADSPTGG